MRSPSIDNLYIQLDKHILLAQGYTEFKELGFIIKACRLKPYDYFFKEKNAKIVLYDNWFDEYCNSLKIKNKIITITYNDLKLETSKITNTDLYYGVSFNKVLKISKLAYVMTAKDEDNLEDYIVLSLLGVDNYLRTYIYVYGQWQTVSSLLLGLAVLKDIKKYLFLKGFIILKNKGGFVLPCVSQQAWITCLPVDEDFSHIMSRECDMVSSIFT